MIRRLKVRMHVNAVVSYLALAAITSSSVDAQTMVRSASAPNSGSPSSPDTSSAVSSGIPHDLQTLIGKRVVVGRVPLCVPKTYTVNLTHAGKVASVTGFRKNTKLDALIPSMSRLPESSRLMFADLQDGGLMSFKFDDGTVLDTCGDLGRGAILSSLELAPGETFQQSARNGEAVHLSDATAQIAKSSTQSRPQECPIVITFASSGLSFGHALVDAFSSSEFQQRLDQASHGGAGKHYLDIKVINQSDRPIAAFEFAAVYGNRMGDETTSATYVSQNTQPIKPGGTFKASAMDRTQITQSGSGEVKLYVSRVRFADNTRWEDNGNRTCNRVTQSK